MRAEAASPRAWTVALACALAALALYVLLAQRSFYKLDGEHLILAYRLGRSVHEHHLLYLPLLAVVDSLGSLLGMSTYRASVLLSALGAATGCAVAHLGFARLGLDRGKALCATALVALCPAVLFFATVSEVHGPFFVGAGLVFLASIEVAQRPCLRSGLVLGLATLFGYGLHATGILLPFLAIPLVLGLAQERARAYARPLALALGVHAGFVALLALAERVGDLPFGPSQQADFASQHDAFERGIGDAIRVLGVEWGLALLPLSLVAIAALFDRRTRRLALALHVALVPYLGLCVLLIPEEREFGAYLLPLVIPAALLAVRTLPRALAVFGVGLAFAVGLADVRRHDRPFPYESFAGDLESVFGEERPLLLLGHHAELRSCLLALPAVPVYPLYFLATDNAELRAMGPGLDPFLRLPENRGRSIFMSEVARVTLSSNPSLPEGPAVLRRLAERFRFEKIVRGHFTAWRLVPLSEG